MTKVLLSYGWKQPVDLGLCLLRFGCRYLRVPHTLLMAVNPSTELLARLRSAQEKASDGDLASLEGLNLRERTLRFADLQNSSLYAAALTKVDLRGANLQQAALQGATLFEAQLQGATLSDSELQGADLLTIKIWQTAFERADLSLTDLRSVFFDELDDKDRAEILASFDAIPNANKRAWAVAALNRALTPQTPPWRGISGVIVFKFVIVDDLHDMRWGAIAHDKKTASEAKYDRALAPYLAKLAETDEFVVKGIERRFPLHAEKTVRPRRAFWSNAARWQPTERQRALWPNLARRILDARKDGKITLPNNVAAELEKYLVPAPEP